MFAMQFPPAVGFTSLVGRIGAFFAAVGGITLLLDRFGVNVHESGSLFAWLFWPAIAIWLLTDILCSPATTRSRAGQFLFGHSNLKGRPNELTGTATVAGFFLVLFAILLWKNVAHLKSQFDIHWHITFLNYDIAWHTPIFSLAGNILYEFEIQPPFNTNLAPLNGIAHFVSPEWQFVASYVLFYLAMSALLWAIGWTVGLRPVPRTICAALAALMTTIPWGLDHLLPFLPPPFVFVTQAMLTRIYEELGILSLTTALLFFWIGQPQRLIANVTIGLGFAAVCYIVLLAYPALAFFQPP
jgi:hypothetical protein